jgi:hypothetical protein
MEARGSERRPSDRKPTSWTARILAPLLLVIVAAAIVLIVSGSLSGDDSDSDSNGSQTQAGGCNPPADAAVEAGFYTVKPEEDLNIVAERTCNEVDRLLRLNPELDPQTIPVGACVNLRRDGCAEAG